VDSRLATNAPFFAPLFSDWPETELSIIDSLSLFLAGLNAFQA